MDDCLVLKPPSLDSTSLGNGQHSKTLKKMFQNDQNDIQAAKKIDALSLSSIVCPSSNSITSTSKLMAQLIHSFYQFIYSDLCKGPPLGRAILVLAGLV